jgi:hypothetical protein
MSIHLSCYNGHRLTALDEHFGTKGKCPVCGVVVPVPRPSRLTQPTAVTEEDANAPQIIPTGESLAEEATPLTQYPGMPKVAQGLSYYYARIVVYLLTIFVISVSVAFGTFGDIIPVLHEVYAVGWVLTVVLWYIQPILGLVGSILCLDVPWESGGKGYVIASVVLDLIAIPIGTVLRLADQNILWAAPLGFLALVLFMFFLTKVATFLHRKAEERAAAEVFVDGLKLLIPPSLIGLLIWVHHLNHIPRFFPLIATILFFAWLYLGIKFLFSLVDLIGGLRDAIRARLP